MTVPTPAPRPAKAGDWYDYSTWLDQRTRTALPGSVALNVQAASGSWRYPKATVDSVRAYGSAWYWVCDASAGKYPTAADGLFDGDVVNGVPPSNAPGTVTTVTVSAAQQPVAVDRAGTASDAVRLGKVDGVTWTVDGVDYASSDFTWFSLDVPYARGGAVTITAKASSSQYTLSGATAWPLTFTTGSVVDSYVTADSFTRADGALPKGAYATDGSVDGGTGNAVPRIIECVRAGLSITGGKLAFASDGELRALHPEPQAAIEFTLSAMPVSSYGFMVVPAMGGNSGQAQVGVFIGPGGAQLFRITDWQTVYGNAVAVAAGDRIRISYKAGVGTLLKNGAQVATVSQAVTPVSWYVRGGSSASTASEGVIDDMKVIRLA